MTRIELYDYEAAACPTKVRWALAEEGLRWVRHRIDVTEFEHKSAGYVAMYPQGLVPAAKFDGELVVDADKIMMRIAALTESHILNPSGGDYETAVSYWLSRIREFHRGYGLLLYDGIYLPLQARRTTEHRNKALANIADPELRARTQSLVKNGIPPPLLKDAVTRLREAFVEADEVLRSQHWLAGGKFSMADIGLYPYVNSPLQSVSDLWFDRLANLKSWLARLKSRDAYSEAVLEYPNTDELAAAIKLA